MKKKFDAVKMMRSIRAKLQKDYEKKPELREKRLRAIRKKYGIGAKKKKANYNIDAFPSMVAEPKNKYGNK
jgi:hypothetical protein